jgi:TPR repeat protein
LNESFNKETEPYSINDYNDLLKYIEKNNDPKAQYKLGGYYYNGYGTKRNHDETYLWYNLSAKDVDPSVEAWLDIVSETQS